MLASGLHPRQLTSCLQVCCLLTFGPLISLMPVYITLAFRWRSNHISFWPSIFSYPKPTSQTGHARSVPQAASYLPTRSLAPLVPDSPVTSPNNSQKSLFQKAGYLADFTFWFPAVSLLVLGAVPVLQPTCFLLTCGPRCYCWSSTCSALWFSLLAASRAVLVHWAHPQAICLRVLVLGLSCPQAMLLMASAPFPRSTNKIPQLLFRMFCTIHIKFKQTVDNWLNMNIM